MAEYFPSNPEEARAYERGHEKAAFAVALLHLDVTRKNHEGKLHKLEHEAMHDPLTGLLNRRGFTQAFGEYTERCGDGQFGVVYIDLKDFKRINDTLGHETGDKLLIDFATSLHQAVRKENGGMGDRVTSKDVVEHNSDVPADILRLGDEFIVMVDLSRDRQKKTSRKLLELVVDNAEKSPQERLIGAITRISNEMTSMLRNKEIYNGVEVSIGGAIWAEDQSAAELIDAAETGMRAHKNAQRAEDGTYR